MLALQPLGALFSDDAPLRLRCILLRLGGAAGNLVPLPKTTHVLLHVVLVSLWMAATEAAALWAEAPKF